MTVNPLAMAPTSVNPPAQAKPAVQDASREQATTRGVDIDELSPGQRRELEKLMDAARQFEEIFIRQLLKTSKFGGSAAQKGHGQMIVDAVAGSVSQQGGVGLAQALRDTLAEAHLAQSDPNDAG